MRIRKAETEPPMSKIVHQDNYGGLHMLLIWPSGRTISVYADPLLLSELRRVFALGTEEGA